MVIDRAKSSGMIEILERLALGDFPGLHHDHPSLRVDEHPIPVGRLLEQDAGKDGPIGPGHLVSDELRGDLLAGIDDRLDQAVASETDCQGREIGPGPAAPAVNLVAAKTARALGMEEHPLAGSRVSGAIQASEPKASMSEPTEWPPSAWASAAFAGLSSVDQCER